MPSFGDKRRNFTGRPLPEKRNSADLLRHLRSGGVDFVPEPIGSGFAADGREQLKFIDGTDTGVSSARARCSSLLASRRLQRPPELAEAFDSVGDGYDANPG